jgi:hypothetical protein
VATNSQRAQTRCTVYECIRQDSSSCATCGYQDTAATWHCQISRHSSDLTLPALPLSSPRVAMAGSGWSWSPRLSTLQQVYTDVQPHSVHKESDDCMFPISTCRMAPMQSDSTAACICVLIDQHTVTQALRQHSSLSGGVLILQFQSNQ